MGKNYRISMSIIFSIYLLFSIDVASGETIQYGKTPPHPPFVIEKEGEFMGAIPGEKLPPSSRSVISGKKYSPGNPVTLYGIIPGGDYAVMRIDSDSGECEFLRSFTAGLTDKALSGISASPEWIRFGLISTLSRLTESWQDALSDILLGLEDVRWVDEVAFTIANMTPKDLTYKNFDPSILVKNVEYIYLMDDYLDFVDLVEVDDDPRGPYTTIKLRWMKDGHEQEYTLPPEYYYWFVVHPRLDIDPRERVIYINPETGRYSETNGVFWREYYLFSAEGDADYTLHYIMKEPNRISEDYLSELHADAYFEEMDIDPLKLFIDDKGRPLAIEMDKGAGTLISTTIPLEEECFDSGECDLLLNLLTYCNTNDTLHEDSKIAILKDRDIFGYSVPTYTLLDNSYTEITEMEIETFLLIDSSIYEKVIIPCCQTSDFYVTLQENREVFENYVSRGGTLQIDIQQSPLNDLDISAFTYPGSFKVVEDEIEEVIRGGQPLLSDVMDGCSSFWDGVRYDGISGERALSADSFALDRAGYFVSQNLFDNVAEYMATHTGTQRHWQPVRILYNHYGNCGEIQDVLGATGRASLMPVALVNSIEDHVWNEFFMNGAWHPYQVDWSDGDTRIDNNGVASDTLVGGDKNVSLMCLTKGNGHLLNPVERYTDTIDIRIIVRDGNGDPVDGARVLFLSEYFYDSTQLDTTYWSFTDKDGLLETKLGDNRNYYINVRADIGGEIFYYPSGSEDQIYCEQIIESEDAVAGETFEFEIDFDEARKERVWTISEYKGGKDSGLTLKLTLSSPEEVVGEEGMLLFSPPSFLAGYNFLENYNSDTAYVDDIYYSEGINDYPPLSLFLLSEENYEKFLEGENFETLYYERIDMKDEEREINLSIPGEDGYYYLILENMERYNLSRNLKIDFSTSTGAGCQCSKIRSESFPSIALILVYSSILVSFGMRRKKGR